MESLDQIWEMISGPLTTIVLAWTYLRMSWRMDVGSIEPWPSMHWIQRDEPGSEPADGECRSGSWDIGGGCDGLGS